MAADLKLKYGTATAFTVTALNGLASSTPRQAGWTSDSVNNTSTLAVDYLISGELRTHSSAPTADKSILVYAYAAFNATPTWPNLFSSGTAGTQGTATVHDDEQRDYGMVLLWSARTDANTSRYYPMPPKSIRDAFGSVPPYFAIWVVQDTAQQLNASGNVLHYVPVLFQSA